MALTAGRPSEKMDDKTPKQLAIEEVQENEPDKLIGLKRVNIRISEEVRKKAKLKTIEDDTTISDLLRKYLDEYINDLSHVAISKDLYEQVRLKTANEGMTPDELAAKLLSEYINT